MAKRLIVLAVLAAVAIWFWLQVRRPPEQQRTGRQCPDCGRELRQGPPTFEHAKSTWRCPRCDYREHDLDRP